MRGLGTRGKPVPRLSAFTTGIGRNDALGSLLVRLPNHLGDACMTLPALDLLAERGASLTLFGRPWAAELFAGYAWPVLPWAPERGARIAALRAWRRAEPGRGEALLFPNSFSSAWEVRRAGMRATGYRTDGRGWLLAAPVAVPAQWHGDMHTSAYYLHLARTWLGRSGDGPEAAGTPVLRIPDAAWGGARAALARAGVRDGYVVLCPTVRGQHHGKVKAWEGFGRLARALRAAGESPVVCPGPGEEAGARAACPDAMFLEPLDLGAFAALLAGSRLVVANDSGPGHLAGAVGARLIGVFGVTDPAKTRPIGAQVRLVGGSAGWPEYEEVDAAVAQALDLRASR